MKPLWCRPQTDGVSCVELVKMSNYGRNYGAVVMTNTTHHTTYWTIFDQGRAPVVIYRSTVQRTKIIFIKYDR